MQIQSGFSLFPMSSSRATAPTASAASQATHGCYDRVELEGTSMNEIFGRLILAQVTSQNFPCALQSGCQGPLL